MESKWDVYNLLPENSYPRTIYCPEGTPLEAIKESMEQGAITFPVIAKPDHGERGLAVKKIADSTALQNYLRQMPVAFLVQPYISWEHEIGLFYHRMPGQETGQISGIVQKEPVAITGDGIHSVRQLVKRNPRYLLQWQHICRDYEALLDKIPDRGERIELIPYGNHARGSKFTDVSQRITPALTATINRICLNIEGFYYGRLDIKFRSWEALEAGRDFSIIELNGSGSEPTHIYDPGHSLFFAWKEIIRHWNILYRICIANKLAGANCLSLQEGRKEMAAFKSIEKQLSLVNF